MNITLFDQNTLVLLFVAFLGVFIWRCLGVIYSKKIENESIAAKTVNSIAYGMTTAIVCKIVFFPDNALNLIPSMDRIIPFFIGISVFLFFSRNTNLGIELRFMMNDKSFLLSNGVENISMKILEFLE